jgi:hypothetical protein
MGKEVPFGLYTERVGGWGNYGRIADRSEQAGGMGF